MKRKFTQAVILAAALLTFCLAACSVIPTEYPPGSTDELYKDSKSGAELEVYKKDGHVYTVDGDYEIAELAGNSDLEEGKHYKVTADVTYLNGGVAGYVDYPQIDRIISIEEAGTNSDAISDQE